MKLETVKWGILGCGNVTEQKSGPPLYHTRNSEVVAVMRRDCEKAAEYARRHKVKRWYSDADELIYDPEVNAIYVATPPETHAKYAIEAMLAGKAVYVEKPMARSYGECLDMLHVSHQTGLPLFVAYYRRALPGFTKIKELVENGNIGKVHLVNVRFYKPAEPKLNPQDLPWRLRREQSGGGLLFDLASHTLDYLDFVFGAIGNIQSKAYNLDNRYSVEDLVVANWQHESGIVGNGTWCYSTSYNQRLDEVEIIGSHGKISFSTFEFTPIIVESDSGRAELTFDRPVHVQSYLIETVVDSLLGVGNCPSMGISAARTNFVLDELVKSYYNIGKR